MEQKALNISILGAGESGVGAALLAQQKGHSVFVSDFGKIQASYAHTLTQNGVEFEEGKHDFDRILQSDLVIKSPGIPDKVAIIQKIKAAKIPIISEIEFAASYLPSDSKMIAITGSNGKTTTTSLLYHLLLTAGVNVAVGGNIGNSFASLLTMPQKYDCYVLEISSFQLDDIRDFRPDISLLLNITPDHLDRYDYDLAKYAAAKFRIIENQTASDTLIYGADDLLISDFLAQKNTNPLVKKTAFSLEQKSEDYVSFDPKEKQLVFLKDRFSYSTDGLQIKGRHNLYNTMAAVLAVLTFGPKIDKSLIAKGLDTFKSIEHRLESVRTIDGIEFINDSKATNIDATWYALDAMTRPIIWMVGGQDKGNDYSEILPLVKNKVKAIVCLGADNSKIRAAFGTSISTIQESQVAKTAVEKAFKLAESGDVVLLSPACASFDLFKNYKERGDLFKKAVREL